jgi:type III restriction enzyme
LVESKTKDVIELEEEQRKINQIQDEAIRKKTEQIHIVKTLIHSSITEQIKEKKIQVPAELHGHSLKEKTITEVKEKIKAKLPYLTPKEHENIGKDLNAIYTTTVQNLIRNNMLIPNVRIGISQNRGIINDFDLDTSSFSGSILQKEFELLRITIYGQKQDKIKIHGELLLMPELTILEALKKKPEIDYENNSDILYKLCEQAVEAVKSSIDAKEALSDTILSYRELIAQKIYVQVKNHISIETTLESKAEAEPYSLILPWNFTKEKTDDILPYQTYVSPKLLTSKVFRGFKKSCHDKYKFDSLPEKRFAEILEQPNEVIKWLRPASKQFNIWYNNNSERYIPDFVAETADTIYLIEIKAENEIETDLVEKKSEAAIKYCKTATEINLARNEKPWKYVLIPHDKTEINLYFERLMKDYCK